MEALRGNAPPTPARDIWAMGIIAYQMLTGRLPYTEVFRSYQPPPPLPDSLPEPVQAIVKRCLMAHADTPSLRAVSVVVDEATEALRQDPPVDSNYAIPGELVLGRPDVCSALDSATA